MNHGSQESQPEGREIKVSREDASDARQLGESQGGEGRKEIIFRKDGELRKRGTTLDIAGKKFGRLTVASFSHRSESVCFYWKCRCDCGNITIVAADNLKSGHTKSCGCFSKENKSNRATHRKTGSAEHGVWARMLDRIRNPNNKRFLNYGGRGLTVCDRWKSFENFFADMGERPSTKHQIDRKDNNLGYFPENCHWTTMTKNMRNTRLSKRWIVNGVKYESLQMAADVYGLNRTTIKEWCDGRRSRNGNKAKPPKPNCSSYKKYEDSH